MHVPDSMITGSICPVSALISTVGVITSASLAITRKVTVSPARFAAVASLIFAAQMGNFPISGATSGHLIGGVAAAALLGVPMGVLAMTVVVVLQSLLFADGGLGVMGINLMSMAIIGAGVGGILFELLTKNTSRNSIRYIGGLLLASWLSVVLASAFVSGALAACGAASANKVFASMVSVHAVIGLGEAGITTIIVMLMAPAKEYSPKRDVALPLITAGMVAALIGPFACGSPDGLEWVAEKLSFLKESAPAFASPMSDYAISSVSSEIASTALAGIAGVAATFIVAWVMAFATTRNRPVTIKQ